MPRERIVTVNRLTLWLGCGLAALCVLAYATELVGGPHVVAVDRLHMVVGVWGGSAVLSVFTPASEDEGQMYAGWLSEVMGQPATYLLLPRSYRPPEVTLVSGRGGRLFAVPFWMLGAIGAAMAGAPYTRGRRRYRRDCCAGCGYDLTGNVSGRCPECGLPIQRALLGRCKLMADG